MAESQGEKKTMKNELIKFLKEEKKNYLNSVKLYLTDDNSLQDCKKVIELYSDLYNLDNVYITVESLKSLFNLSDKKQMEKLLHLINL